MDFSARLAELDRRLDEVFGAGTSTSAIANQLHNLVKFNPLPPSHEYALKKQAGVLVLLHINRTGSLSVTLTTRSSKLRTHAGETAFPGGKRDEGDSTIAETALREANEEIGLERDALFFLTNFSTFAARRAVVVPCIYFLLAPAEPILASLKPNPDEVSAIFHIPLNFFLGLPPEHPTSNSTTPDEVDDATFYKSMYLSAPVLASAEPVGFYKHKDMVLMESRLYRAHRFTHSWAPTPIWGFSADVLITVALVAQFGITGEQEVTESGAGKLGYARWADGQLTQAEMIDRVLSEGYI